MALVATPSTVWRDPNVMSATANTISSISQPININANNNNNNNVSSSEDGLMHSHHHHLAPHLPCLLKPHRRRPLFVYTLAERARADGLLGSTIMI